MSKSTWGGRRVGAGRKTVNQEILDYVATALSPEVAEKLANDLISKTNGLYGPASQGVVDLREYAKRMREARKDK